MRIELPTASWADTVQRAEDDAHTLTVAAPGATDWAETLLALDPPQPLRIEVARLEPLAVTITF